METARNLPRILIIDESRMVRAMLIKHIRDFYDFREEADGEAGWQVLVLDHSIELVICSLSAPVLDGDGLLVRVRSSRLPRLARMPMLMISGDNDEALARAKAHGASDFVNRGTLAAELLARIDSLLKLAQAQNQLKENIEQHVHNPESGLFTRKYIELQAAQAMSHALRHNSEVSAIVMGFDNVGGLREEHGADVMEQLQKRFVDMLVSKIRKEDSLGHFAGSQLVVISPGTPYPACESFGNRLREAIRVANISIHGRRLNLSVSVGVSNSPIDRVTSAGALVELAGARLRQAQQAGGNRVIACREDGAVVASIVAPAAPSIEQAVELVTRGHHTDVAPYARGLARQLLPLLEFLNRELKWGMPMSEVESSMLDPATPSQKAGQE